MDAQAIRHAATAIALAAGLTLLAPAPPASATAFCEVAATRDGFTALRAGPSASARIVARMRPGDEMRLRERRVGVWQQVDWWRGEERLAGRPARATGFVHRALARDCG